MARSSVVSILIKVGSTGLGAIRSVGNGLRGLKDQIFSLKTAALAVAAVIVQKLGRDLVGAFAAQENAVVKLNAALRVTGRYTEEGSARIQRMAQEMQRLTTVSDEAALAASATVASFAKELTTDQIAEMQQAAIGLAQVLGTDVEGAAVQLGKTLSGEMNALGRLGISIDTTATQQDRFNQIMAKTRPFFQIAVESTQSLMGQFAQAKNQIDEVKETFGQIIVESLNLGSGQESLASKIAGLNEKIRTNMGTWVKWGKVVFAILKALAVTFGNVIKFFFNAGQVIGGVFRIIAISGKRNFQALYNEVVGFVNDLLKVFNKISPIDIPLLSPILMGEVDQALADAKEALQTDAQDIRDSISNIGAAWHDVAVAMKAEPLPAAAFDISKRGGGRNLGPRQTGEDPVALSKRLAAQAQSLQRQFDQNAISTTAFAATLATLGPAMAKLLEPGSGLSGPDLEQFRSVVDGLRGAAAAVGLTFDTSGVKAIGLGEAFVKSARAAEKAAGSLNQVVADMAMQTFAAFGQAITDAFAAMVDGSQSAGQAFASAMLSALAAVAQGFGQYFLVRAAAAIAEALLPSSVLTGQSAGGFAAAAKFTAAAVAMFALSGVLGGMANKSSGGGGGAGGSAAAERQTAEVTREEPPSVLVIEGGLLDMSNPDQADALAAALETLTDRKVIIRQSADQEEG